MSPRLERQIETQGVIPPKELVRVLFKTYASVFKQNQTEHTILYYLYMNKQICSHYKVSDLVEVVALDLIKQAHCLKEEEPTLLDEHNQSVYQESQEKSPPTDYERIDSPLPLPNQVAGQ